MHDAMTYMASTSSVMPRGSNEHACDGVACIPTSRWDADEMFERGRGARDASLVRRFGAFLDDVDMFDAPRFGVSSSEAALMDPQQRMLLSECAACK